LRTGILRTDSSIQGCAADNRIKRRRQGAFSENLHQRSLGILKNLPCNNGGIGRSLNRKPKIKDIAFVCIPYLFLQMLCMVS
jgi:hypothetical protein